ncbi:hypothetical protein pb186bvf_003040 [Paramecium bursaria]
MNNTNAKPATMRPFILRQVKDSYYVNPDSTAFNALVERRIQFVQGANTFLAVRVFELTQVMLTYDGIQHIIQAIHYFDICREYAYMIIGLLGGNAFWILCSIFGFLSIDGKNSQKINRYYILLLLVLFSRFVLYGTLGYFMNQFQNGIFDGTNKYCGNLDQQGLVFIQIAIESTVLVVMIIFLRSIREYVRIWEESDKMKNWTAE